MQEFYGVELRAQDPGLPFCLRPTQRAEYPLSKEHTLNKEYTLNNKEYTLNKEGTLNYRGLNNNMI